jgi:DNA-binding LacI/PurR family transcriptional regulator
MMDIAKELNISITTFYFVVNGKNEEKGMSSKMTKKVNYLIKKRGFIITPTKKISGADNKFKKRKYPLRNSSPKKSLNKVLPI